MWYVLLLVTAIGAYADTAKPEAVIGIDIGATNSYAAVYKDGKIQIIVKEQGLHKTQSNVALVEERHVDDAIEEHAIKNSENAAFKDEKRLEKNWEEATDPKCTNNKCHGSIDVELTLEVMTTIVKKMKKDIETNIGEVSHAVVTVPTYFNDPQRKSAKEACEIAGLNVLRVINDPTAAVIAHGFDKIERERNVMVFAMGGTRFDVSILNIDNGIIDTLATSGDTRLGGDAFDQRVMEHFTNQLIEIEPNVKSDDEAINKLRKEVEEAKIKLTTDYLAKIEVNTLITGEDFSVILTRHKFEELNKDLFELTLVAVENALKEAEMSKEEIDDIIFVGGSTKIPKIQQLLKELFGKEPSRSIEPDVVAAIGAAMYADKVLKEPEPPVYVSMNPLTIGVETAGRIMTPMIQRNTITPTKKKQTFSNAHDNQMTMTIKVYEGERFSTIDNNFLGKFDLVIPPGPKNKREVEVILEIDANEVLLVTAEDKHTGVKETMVIENNRERWTKEYIERMIADGEKFKLDDVKAKEKATNTNELLIEGHYDVEFKERDKNTVTVAKGKMDEL